MIKLLTGIISPTSSNSKITPSLTLIIILLLIGLGLDYYGSPVYWPGFISMVVFYGLIFYLGMYASSLKSSNNLNQLLLAGRSMPVGIAVFTMSATWVGGGYINGTAEYTASSGLAWVQAPWGYALSLIIGGLFFAGKMRTYRFKTMLDPLSQRFGKKMTAVLFLPALSGEVFWTAAILTALGTTFGTVLSLDFNTSILLSATIAIIYTAIGGLWAVALTDIFQMILLLAGLFVILPFALDHTGGLAETWNTYSQNQGTSLLPPWKGWNDAAWGNTYWQWWDYALLLTFGGIPWQVYFQRVLSSKDAKTAKRLSIIAGFVCILAAIPAVLIGMIGNVVDWNAIGINPPEEAALTLPYAVRYLTPPLVATVGLGAIAAAVMSSADSSILSASSMFTWNVYKPLFIKKQDPKKHLPKIIKRSIWIIGISATLLALQVKSVYVLWSLCSDFVYCILFPQLTTALFDKKANVYGSISGFAVALFLRMGGGEAAFGLEPFLPYPMIENGEVLFPFRTMAMASSLITILIVSRLTQKTCPATPLVPCKD
ncbi:sodium:solute symporter family protein [Rapidithrix thailandica]|uniref:Sodium:solute symporter family protein n=1 Tax=Rapidithrix thailandica TaxID=413964 RepID=A0AAW9RXZ3_9BACT